jgi:hypothetical protein
MSCEGVLIPNESQAGGEKAGYLSPGSVTGSGCP